MQAVASALVPISPHAPAGRDARLEPEHELVRCEVEKITGVSGAPTDWALVESVGLELLRAKSKDLLIGCYVAYALVERRGVDGASLGLGLVAELMARFGGELHPARARARVNALQWFLDRIGAWFEGAVNASSMQARAMHQQVAALRVSAANLLGEGAPSFAALLRGVERLQIGARSATPEVAVSRQLPNTVAQPIAPQPRMAAQPCAAQLFAAQPCAAQPFAAQPFAAQLNQPTETSSPSSTAATEGPVGALHPIVEPPADTSASHQITGEVSTAVRLAEPSVSFPEQRAAMEEASFVFGAAPEQPALLQAYVVRAGALLVELGRARFAADKADARAYRWLRAGLFLRWEAAPAANRRGRIENDGPSSAKRAELLKAVKEGAWEAALVLSESLLVRNPFWLDLQRISALALQMLGEGFALARAQVEREARALIARLPTLLALQFADGSPLGSPDTLAWLKSTPEALRAESKSAPVVPSYMLSAVLRGEPAQLAAFEASLRRCTSQREAFQLRLELAEMLCDANRLEQAKQLYLGLEYELDRYNLDAWEPELACRVLRPLWRLLSAEQSKGVAHPEGVRISARLAQLAPTALL